MNNPDWRVPEAQSGADVLWHLFRYLRNTGAPFPLHRAPRCHEFDLRNGEGWGGEWHLSCNGHDHAVRNAAGKVVPPFSCYCERGGVAVGVLDLVGQASVFAPLLLPELSAQLDEAAGPEAARTSFEKGETL